MRILPGEGSRQVDGSRQQCARTEGYTAGGPREGCLEPAVPTGRSLDQRALVGLIPKKAEPPAGMRHHQILSVKDTLPSQVSRE